MKKIIFFTSLLVITTSCYDEFYVEGRVETRDATDVTHTSALLYGHLKLGAIGSEADVNTSCGFVIRSGDGSILQTNFNPVSGGDFSAIIDGLYPNTKYTVQACVNVSHNALYLDKPLGENDYHKTTDTYYGNVIEFTTLDGEVSQTLPYVELRSAGIAVQYEDISSSTVNWISASSLCNNSISGDFTDWRLPTIDELATIYSNKNLIGKFRSFWYWSSNYSGSSFGGYYGLDFSDGSQINTSSTDCYTRCVRTLTN